MVKTLVLVRHGKAEKAVEGVDDSARELTQTARRALETAYPRTFALAEEEDDVHVWCSSAIRAMQTADIVARALDVDDIEVFDAIYEQNVETMLGMLETSDEQTVVMVGHVPSLNKLASRLTGTEITLGTGAVIALDLTEGTKKPAPILWYVAGPSDTLWSSLVSIEDEVSASADALAKEAKAFFKDSGDAKKLCDFRVSVRRMRSLISFLSPWVSGKQAQQIDKVLRGLQDATARLRGIDILSETVDELVDSGELGDNSLLPVACANERQLECESFLAFVHKRKLRRKLKDAMAAARTIRWKKSVSASGLTDSDLKARFDEELDTLDELLFGIDLSDAEAVHDARLDAKELHYVANRLGVVLGDERAQMSQYMDEIQADLGALDYARTNAVLAHEFEHGPRFRGVRADLGVVARDQEEVVSAIVSGLMRRDSGAAATEAPASAAEAEDQAAEAEVDAAVEAAAEANAEDAADDASEDDAETASEDEKEEPAGAPDKPVED